MACVFDGGVILGADSRTSAGSYVANRVSRKISKVLDNVYVCRSGSAADTQAVADYVILHANQHALELGEKPLVSSIANLFRLIAYNNRANLSAGLIVAGVDAEGPHVYSIPLGGSIIKQEWSIGGSGSTFIYGLCDRTYKPGMSKDEAVDFVKTSIFQAMARDGSSGGIVRTVVLPVDGPVEEAWHETELI
jgi:20S proteasome subunit beta 1